MRERWHKSMTSCVRSERLHCDIRNDSAITESDARAFQHLTHRDDKRIRVSVLTASCLISALGFIGHVAEAAGFVTVERWNCLDC